MLIRYAQRPETFTPPDDSACACPLCVRRAQLPTEKRRLQLFEAAVLLPFQARQLGVGVPPLSLELLRAIALEFATLNPVPAELAYVLKQLKSATA